MKDRGAAGHPPPAGAIHEWADPIAPKGWLVRVKAVPGAARTRIHGPLGDHLKIQVAVAPEGGKANAAIREVLAALFGSPVSEVQLRSGPANPRKTFVVGSGSLPETL